MAKKKKVTKGKKVLRLYRITPKPGTNSEYNWLMAAAKNKREAWRVAKPHLRSTVRDDYYIIRMRATTPGVMTSSKREVVKPAAASMENPA
jgi:hypothetical protein